jgi:PAS domain S-box-containing protein
MQRVLIVDDKPENLDYLNALLSSSGFVVAAASDGAEALREAQMRRPDLVISDLLMPVMDGYTLLRHWKADQQLHSIPFLVFTATYTGSEDESLALQLGADGFLLKPCEPAELLRRIGGVLASAPRLPAAGVEAPLPDTVVLREYNEALIRKLEQKTEQLQGANRALQREVIQRSEIARMQIAILNALPAHVAVIDAQGTIVALNESWVRMSAGNSLGSQGLGLGSNYLDVCARARGPGAREAGLALDGIWRVLKGELPRYSLEYDCHTPVEQRWFRMNVAPLQTGTSRGAVIMHVDTTERKEIERRYLESQANYLLLLNSTAEGIYGLDRDGVCTFCNPAAARLLGFDDPQALIGVPVHAHHHHSYPDGRPYPAQDCNIHRAFLLEQGVHCDDEVFFHRDGSSFPVEYWSYPIHHENQTIGAVVTFLDISERRNLEAQFLQAQKLEAVGRLAGGVAHDFNNALQVVLTCTELLESRLDPTDIGRSYLAEIKSAGMRGGALTRQLLAFSRKQPWRPSVIDLNALITDIEPMLHRMLGEDLSLSTRCTARMPAILADHGQIEQVLMNLVVNARDAMPLGGELLIETTDVEIDAPQVSADPAASGRPDPARSTPASGRYVRLRVSDTGHGMDPATCARIFEPFFTTKEAGKGTGLGLSTVYGIVRQNNASIAVESAPGHGTSFLLYFPASAAVAVADLPAVAESTRGGTERLLLVEDEDALRELICTTLRGHGYRVVEARLGADAIDRAMAAPLQIDLLLTDVILPDVSGPQVAGVLLSVNPALKVLYMSGYTDDYVARHGALGLDTPLLEKPFTVEDLLRRVRAVLDG